MTNREAYENMWDELEQYRAIGTVEEIKSVKKYIDLKRRCGTPTNTIDLCAEYIAIGTVEECREAREKQKPQKPFKGADFMVVRDDDGSHIWESDYICHECGMGITREYICCPYCGTYIDWSKEGDKSREEDDH